VIPGDGGVGVNAFFTVNQTGNGGGFSPDPFVISGGHLTLFPTSGGSVEFWLADLLAGDYFETTLYPDTTTFSSATFSGFVQGLNANVSATLLPTGSDISLLTGQFVVLYADNQPPDQPTDTPTDSPTGVPEPSCLTLLASAGTAFAMKRAGARR
jgi:hypothetical protein